MAYIEQHTRVVSGKVQMVQAYDDKRHTAAPPTTHHRPRRPANPGMIKMRETITGLLRTEAGQKELEVKVKAGGFMKSMPEVVMLYGVEQGVHHPLRDAFDHTMEVIRQLPAGASDNLRWAALLHDIGKEPTQRPHPTHGAVFNGHEKAGHDMLPPILNRLGFSPEDQGEIKHLVLHHGGLRTYLLRGDDKEAREFMDHPHFDTLLDLHRADVKASGRDPKEVLDKVAELKSNLTKNIFIHIIK